MWKAKCDSTLSTHFERHHKDQIKNEDLVVCVKKEKTILRNCSSISILHLKSRFSQKMNRIKQ